MDNVSIYTQNNNCFSYFVEESKSDLFEKVELDEEDETVKQSEDMKVEEIEDVISGEEETQDTKLDMKEEEQAGDTEETKKGEEKVADSEETKKEEEKAAEEDEDEGEIDPLKKFVYFLYLSSSRQVEVSLNALILQQNSNN